MEIIQHDLIDLDFLNFDVGNYFKEEEPQVLKLVKKLVAILKSLKRL